MPDLLLQFCRPGKAPAATRHKAAPCPAALRMPGLLLRFCRPGKAPAATRHKSNSVPGGAALAGAAASVL
ncbi:hypothetical protein IE987_06875 [Klebsiella pneumoniae]|uniref:Uncharacterized protein n=1 Tax=Klebsiella pneumoniae TaxID=573 RepID=A0A927DLP7_KLEPN|nr:hypothetical protein [Klebsiella pneumoniae]